MSTEVVMPQMGESIAEGTITKCLKKVGERVERDEPLFEISTDKVDAEIPSPAAGTLTEVRFKEGDTVEVNTDVAVLDATVEDLRRTKSSPLVRKIAQEHGVDISKLEGTGLSGRVTKNDILSFIESGPAPAPASTATAPAAPAPTYELVAPP